MDLLSFSNKNLDLAKNNAHNAINNSYLKFDSFVKDNIEDLKDCKGWRCLELMSKYRQRSNSLQAGFSIFECDKERKRIEKFDNIFLDRIYKSYARTPEEKIELLGLFPNYYSEVLTELNKLNQLPKDCAYSL